MNTVLAFPGALVVRQTSRLEGSVAGGDKCCKGSVQKACHSLEQVREALGRGEVTFGMSPQVKVHRVGMREGASGGERRPRKQHNEKKLGGFEGSAGKVGIKKHGGLGRRPSWKSGVGVGLLRARGH